MISYTFNFLQLNVNADHHKCAICSRLNDLERGFQKGGRPDEDEFLPEAWGKSLVNVRVVGTIYEPVLYQCPNCTICYLYWSEYDFLYGGSEDWQYLKRLTIEETLASLKESLRNRKPDAKGMYLKEPFSKISYESVNVSAAEPEFIVIRYFQLDDGTEMGGILRLERQNVPAMIDRLMYCVYVYGQPETVFERGADKITIFESGPEQQPFYNILNRRAEAVSNSGLSGLLLTRRGAEEMISKLLNSVVG